MRRLDVLARLGLDFLELDGEIRHELKPPARLLAETPDDDPFELARQGRDGLTWRLRCGRQHGGQRRRRRIAAERPRARRHLVEQRAEAEDVGPRIDRFAFGLLGRHVGRRPHDPPLARLQRIGEDGRLRRIERRDREFGQSEIEDLHATVVGHHQVRRLQIAVHDAGRMCLGQCIRRLGRRSSTIAELHAAAADQSIQRVAGDVLHHDVVETVLAGDLVDRDDVRMVERRGGLRLLHEPALTLGVGDGLGAQDLDGNEAIETGVPGLVDLPHPAGSELLDDFVVTDSSPDHAG